MVNHAAHVARYYVGGVGNVITFGLFLSPAWTVWDIIEKKDVTGFSPSVFVAGLMNCALWVLYGSPKVHPDSTFIWISNSIGLILYAIYLTIFLIYSKSNKRRVVVVGFIIAEIAAMAVISSLALTLLHTTDKRTLVVGILCVIFNIGLYASPLTIMWSVIKTKNSEFLPAPVCAFNLLNGLVWTTYGLLQFDINLLIGNGLGVLLAVIQVFLKWYYYQPKKGGEEAKKTVELKTTSVV